MLDAIAQVADDLESLGFEAVFTGASTLPLLVTDRAVAADLRSTRDVDAIVSVRDLGHYHGLQASLRRLGYRDGLAEDDPLCRLWRGDVPVDFMPTPDPGVGTDNRWFAPGFQRPARSVLPNGRSAAHLDAVYFVAAKIEAFRDRGRLRDGLLDWYGSADLEDLIALVDGRAELGAEIGAAPEDVAGLIGVWAYQVLQHARVADVLAGHGSSPGRVGLLVDRLTALVR